MNNQDKAEIVAAQIHMARHHELMRFNGYHECVCGDWVHNDDDPGVWSDLYPLHLRDEAEKLFRFFRSQETEYRS
jgi:hypothetical protein